MSAGEGMLVRCVQLHSGIDPAGNLESVLTGIAEARADGVDLLVFPETTASRSDEPGTRLVAERLDEGFVAAVVAATATDRSDGPSGAPDPVGADRGGPATGPTVVVGTVESNPDGPPFNTLVAAQDGQVVAVYRKVHLYDAFSFIESATISPGDGILETFQVKGFCIGMVNCYDLRFPEISRLLADRGVDVLLAPASWVAGPLKEEHWTTLCRARALENTCYLAAAGQAGGNRIGRSLVVAPDGVVHAMAGPEVTTLTHRLSRAALDRARQEMPVLAQRRFRVDPELITRTAPAQGTPGPAPVPLPRTAHTPNPVARPAEVVDHTSRRG
ncbi:carbon-nitrogen hydrolase family protein [Streptomyces sp. NBC_00690]|uniref:carbon-nitrogen hydrolase family protein n=1 Tax=Streptomyces sp. NBC_00690 TaxID=2975808 RepID=UPI002E2C3DC0|nr:carbon-nitrogen hydrolase family protein [Streptomyces sp. NBC_00690]